MRLIAIEWLLLVLIKLISLEKVHRILILTLILGVRSKPSAILSFHIIVSSKHIFSLIHISKILEYILITGVFLENFKEFFSSIFPNNFGTVS